MSFTQKDLLVSCKKIDDGIHESLVQEAKVVEAVKKQNKRAKSQKVVDNAKPSKSE